MAIKEIHFVQYGNIHSNGGYYYRIEFLAVCLIPTELIICWGILYLAKWAPLWEIYIKQTTSCLVYFLFQKKIMSCLAYSTNSLLTQKKYSMGNWSLLHMRTIILLVSIQHPIVSNKILSLCCFLFIHISKDPQRGVICQLDIMTLEL